MQLNLGKVRGESCHVRYSTHQDGRNMTPDWAGGKNWIGFAIADKNAAPTNPAAYEWSQFIADNVTLSTQIKQGTGNSTTDLMSQDAVTRELNTKLSILDSADITAKTFRTLIASNITISVDGASERDTTENMANTDAFIVKMMFNNSYYRMAVMAHDSSDLFYDQANVAGGSIAARIAIKKVSNTRLRFETYGFGTATNIQILQVYGR